MAARELSDGRSGPRGEPSLDEVLAVSSNHPFFSTGGPWLALEGVVITNIATGGKEKTQANPEFEGTYRENRGVITAYDFETGSPFIAPDNKLNRDHLEALGFEENKRAPDLMGGHTYIDNRTNKPLSEEWDRIKKLVSEAKDVRQSLGGINATGINYSIPGETVMVSVSPASPAKVPAPFDGAIEGGRKAIEGDSGKGLPAVPEKRGILGMFRKSPKHEPDTTRKVIPADAEPLPVEEAKPVIHQTGINDLGVNEHHRFIGKYNVDKRNKVVIYVTAEGEARITSMESGYAITSDKILEAHGYKRDEKLEIPLINGEKPEGHVAEQVFSRLEHMGAIRSDAAMKARGEQSRKRLAHHASNIELSADISPEELAEKARRQLGIPDGASNEEIERAVTAARREAERAGAPLAMQDTMIAAANLIMGPSNATAKMLLAAMDKAQRAKASEERQ